MYCAGLSILEGRFDTGTELARAELSLGRRIEHPSAEIVYGGHRAGIHRERGLHERVIALFTPAFGHDLGPIAWAKAMAARSQLARGREADARTLSEELAAADFEDLPRDIRWTNTAVEIANLCADLSDLARAERLCELLSPVAEHHGLFPVPICWGGPASRPLARLLAHRGEREAAATHFAAALESCEKLGARPMHAHVALDYAGFLGDQGDRAAARELCGAAAAIAEELGMPEVLAAARAGAALEKRGRV